MQKQISLWKKQSMRLVAATVALAMVTGQVEGKSETQLPPQEGSVLQLQAAEVSQPEALPAPPQEPASTTAGAYVHGPDCACGPVCVYNPCIKYRGEHRLKRVCCGCDCPTFEKVTMTVEDPARCGCAVEIPICVPTCLKGEPCVEARCGVAGRGIVWLKWCCGYKVRVLFAGNNECKGRDVIVSYFGK